MSATDDPALQLRAYEVALNLTAEYGDPARLRQLAARSLELAELAGGPPTALRAHGCLIVAAYLARLRPARFVDARQFLITDDQFTQAGVLFGKTNRATRRYFARTVGRRRTRMIPVVT